MVRNLLTGRHPATMDEVRDLEDGVSPQQMIFQNERQIIVTFSGAACKVACHLRGARPWPRGEHTTLFVRHV